MSGIWRVRADTGGTFTDVWARDPEGGEHRAKVLSDGRVRLALSEAGPGRWRLEGGNPPPDGLLVGWRDAGGVAVSAHRGGVIDFDGEVIDGRLELDGGEEAPVVGARWLTRTAPGEALPAMDFRVATTRGTNALLEGKGARLALVVTRGFEDLLEIRDQRRERLFELEQPLPVVLPERVVGIAGRLAADGGEVEPLDEPALRELSAELVAAGLRVVAVALMHAWRNPAHEQRVAAILEEAGIERVTCSSVVAPSIRLLPRAETAVADAFLAPVMRHFIERVSEPLGEGEPWLMTSAGGLVPAGRYHAKDSLLSGPAGGLIGAVELARAAGFEKLLSFDMGGTSTDVARVGGALSYRQEQVVGPARVLAPALKIETVAAGGGSIVAWREGRLEVGPESAGSDPGPACYGRGGPLTVTDVNLLLGLMDAGKAGIPLDESAAAARFAELREAMRAGGEEPGEERKLLEGIRMLAVERMAEAIRSVSVREGVSVEDHVLLAFGGAGPQHACAVAERLGLDEVLVPADAGLLSAWGLERARRQEQRMRPWLRPLEADGLAEAWRGLESAAAAALGVEAPVFRRIADLRVLGQDSTLEVETEGGESEALRAGFGEAYRRVFGYPVPAGRTLELASLRVVAEESAAAAEPERFGGVGGEGPELRQDAFSTCVIPAGWSWRRGSRGTLRLTRRRRGGGPVAALPAAVRSGLFRSRFEGLLAAMGESLRRTALSTNVKERLDFSCALLDARGRLVASAPHVPVHLGALGVCVRETVARLDPGPGDVAVTNHPGCGGSHLPDITVIAPVFDAAGERIGFVANRAHHAELGGKAPGSMPADARRLVEEGVVIEPRLLVAGGEPRLDEVERLLREAPYPSRRPGDNLADLEAQLAACHFGRAGLESLAAEHGGGTIREELGGILEHGAALMRSRLEGVRLEARVSGELDDGTPLAVALRAGGGRIAIDFGGSGAVHPGNLNATPAIVRSVVLYVLRLWLDEAVPLNEGLLEPVAIEIPPGLLRPDFEGAEAPAVVGGNVELSQRLADLLLEGFGLAANGPGTMNNFLFGRDDFGYYETLAGGAGAGPAFDGASGRHAHMTNTALTDPEVVEHRYPVRVRAHAVRRGSGGVGARRGGDGIRRELEFLEALTVSFLTQRRSAGPRGLHGGGDGAPGRQWRIDRDGVEHALAGTCTVELAAGERVVIETPGGGGWGAAG